MNSKEAKKAGRKPHQPISNQEILNLIGDVRTAIEQLEKSLAGMTTDGKICTVNVDEKEAALFVPIQLRSLAVEIDKRVAKGEVTVYTSTPEGISAKRAKPSG